MQRSKKPRTDDFEFKIPVAELEVELEQKKTRKGGVKADAYLSDDEAQTDSDESQELNEQLDMFDQPETKKYMKSTDFEGQEWSKPLQFEDEFPIESFNMDQELEQGDFTESGVYVPKKDDSGFHDSWLNELTDQDIEKAKMYHEKTTVVEEVESISLDLLYLKLFAFIKPGENALGAVKRLGQATSITPKWKKKVVKKGVEYSEDEIKVMARQLDELTSIAQKILENDVNVYEKSFEEIALALKLKNLI